MQQNQPQQVNLDTIRLNASRAFREIEAALDMLCNELIRTNKEITEYKSVQKALDNGKVIEMARARESQEG